MSTSPGTMRGRARGALLDAAQITLSERGFAGASARTVCDAAGTNLRSIAYHYGSLRELLLTALSDNFRTWMAPMIATITDQHGDPRQRLNDGLALFVDELPQRSGLVAAWVEAVALSCHDPDLRQRLADNQAGFTQALTATLTDAGASRPTALAAALITLCDGLMIRFLLHGDATHPLTLAQDLAAETRVLESLT